MGDRGERKEKERKKKEGWRVRGREREIFTLISFFFKNSCKMSTFMDDRITFYFCQISIPCPVRVSYTSCQAL